MSTLHEKVLKLALEQPELRGSLIPLLFKQANPNIQNVASNLEQASKLLHNASTYVKTAGVNQALGQVADALVVLERALQAADRRDVASDIDHVVKKLRSGTR